MATVLNYPWKHNIRNYLKKKTSLHFPYFAQPSSGPGLEALIGHKPHAWQSSRPAKTVWKWAITQQISSWLQFPPFLLTEDTAAWDLLYTEE